jgi:serine/threonine protein kinase
MERFLKSRYRIGEKLGESPFSITYKGYLMGTEVPVIIKIYKRAALNSPLINKLRPKVTKIISMDHPNIARVIDGDYGWQGFYYVREYVESFDLEEYLNRDIPNVDVSIKIMKQILEALVTAEHAGLIHGSLNMKNVFVSGSHEVKLADFILEPMVRANPALLAQSAAENSAFMAPEQIKGQQASQRSDVYSAGIIFYRLLAGKFPFVGQGGLDTALSHVQDDPLQPANFNKEVPDYLNELVMKMIEKDPVQRIASAADALNTIEGKRLEIKLPVSDLSNIIYDGESDPIIFDVENAPKIKPEKRKNKVHFKKVPLRTIMALFILIAIASGLWYAFLLNFIDTR